MNRRIDCVCTAFTSHASCGFLESDGKARVAERVPRSAGVLKKQYINTCEAGRCASFFIRCLAIHAVVSGIFKSDGKARVAIKSPVTVTRRPR